MVTDEVADARGELGEEIAAAAVRVAELGSDVAGLRDRARGVAEVGRRGPQRMRAVLVDLDHAAGLLRIARGWVETAAGRLGMEVGTGDGG